MGSVLPLVVMRFYFHLQGVSNEAIMAGHTRMRRRGQCTRKLTWTRDTKMSPLGSVSKRYFSDLQYKRMKITGLFDTDPWLTFLSLIKSIAEPLL